MSLAATGSSRLFGRDEELAIVAEAVGAASRGRPGLIAIEGAGAIGKTRLLLRARDRAAAAGMQVLAARGSERERRRPFGVVEQLFGTGRAAGGGEAADTDTSFATSAALLGLSLRSVAPTDK